MAKICLTKRHSFSELRQSSREKLGKKKKETETKTKANENRAKLITANKDLSLANMFALMLLSRTSTCIFRSCSQTEVTFHGLMAMFSVMPKYDNKRHDAKRGNSNVTEAQNAFLNYL